MAIAAPPLERLFTLRQLQTAGYQDRMTLLRRIHNDEIPAVRVGNTFKIRERHLGLIAETLSGPEVDSPVAPVASVDELSELVKALVDTFPALDADRKRELGQLLAPSAT